MAYQGPLRRSLLPLLFILTLTTCSTDALDVDRSNSVASIRSHSRHHRLTPVQTEAAYPPADPVAASDAYGAPQAAPDTAADAPASPKPLPMIDSDEAIAAGAGTGSGDGTRQLGAPPRILGQLHSQPQMDNAAPAAVATGEGVNMDAGFGVDQTESQDQPGSQNQAQSQAPAGTSLAGEEANQIAETNPQEPLVGGIGTDNPVAYPSARATENADASDTLDPEPEQQALAPQSYPQQSSMMIGSGRERTALTLPRRQRYSGGQQVAMLPRPVDPLAGPVVEAPPEQPGVMPASEQSCRAALQRMGVQYRDVTPIYNGPTCGIPYPVKVYGFASNIAMKPAVTLNCQVTLAFAQWVKNELNPSARYRYWSGVKTIIPLGGYSCRRMNSSARNPWSEHAHGNAIDVGKFVLNNGQQIDVRKPGFFSFRQKGLLNAVRSDSCKYFHTVLGPGSDPHHKDHFHFDLRARKSGYRHCD